MKRIKTAGGAIIFYSFLCFLFWVLAFSVLGQSPNGGIYSSLNPDQPRLTSPKYSLKVDIPKPDKYKFRKGKIIGLSILASASFVDGVLEGYQFDGRKSFERKWGVSEESFWGSESWRSVYNDGDPDKGFKSWFHEQSGALDFYHVADDFRKWGYISGGAVYGIGCKDQKKFKNFLIDLVICGIVTSGSKRIGMKWIRN